MALASPRGPKDLGISRESPVLPATRLSPLPLGKNASQSQLALCGFPLVCWTFCLPAGGRLLTVPSSGCPPSWRPYPLQSGGRHHTDIERYDQDWAIAKEQYAKAVANYEQDIATYDKAPQRGEVTL